MQHLPTLALAGLFMAALACATSPTPSKTTTAPIEPTPTPQSTAAAIEDDVVRETRKTAAAQLECPEDQLTISCTRKDVHGGCIAIQAKGCGKVLDYDFGNE